VLSFFKLKEGYLIRVKTPSEFRAKRTSNFNLMDVSYAAATGNE
jgi:hypothetical protein